MGPAALPVPVHAEAVEGEPAVVRWRMPAGTLGFVGTPSAVPPVLRSLLEDGTVETLAVEPACVRTRLAAGRSWRAEGDRVRGALQEALATPSSWRPPAGGGSGEDVLRMAVREVIEGEVGAYVRSHGGEVELVDVHDDEVEVRLSGTCTHCPASDVTLTDRVAVAVRDLYPAVRAVRSRTDPGPSAGRRLLGLSPRPRR